jgi:hypothetical protein
MDQTVETVNRAGGRAPLMSPNVRHLCRLEIPGGGQVTIDGKYCYVGYMKNPQGTTIFDISDPRRPKELSTIPTDDPMTHSHKVRVVGDLMFVNAEHQPGTGQRKDYFDGGFRIYDIKDRTKPKLITHVPTHGKGAHRFDVDENYLYLSTEMEGFVGNILVIYDIRNPAKPIEVSRWWMKGQNVAAGETPHPKKSAHRLHHGLRYQDKIYAGCWFSGVAIIDVSDIRNPKTLSHVEYDPPCPEPSHTLLRVPFPIKGRTIAISTEEERKHRGDDTGKPHAPFRTWDVTDPAKPVILNTYHVPENASPFNGDDVRFGAHQLREAVDPDCLAYVTWFAAGLRILDISDPANPAERGFFIPTPSNGQKAPQANDVEMDDRGILYLTDKAHGFDVIEFTR